MQTEQDRPVIDAGAFRAIGLDAKFDQQALELRISIAPELRKTNQVFLSDRGMPPKLEDALAPNGFASFINTRVGQDFYFNHQDGTDGRRPLRAELEGAINIHNWVLESTESFVTNQAHPATRGDTRIVRDDPTHMLRFEAGDLSYPMSNYQRFRPMAGLSFSSNFGLQPYRVTVPTSNTEIFLKSPSKVVVFVNGYQNQVLYLPAGRHNLRNLALGNGINFIRLEITDDVGRTEIMTFPWVSDADLLAKGLNQVSYSFGFPSTYVGNHREYNKSLPTTSVYHRYGLADQTTLGGNFQYDHRQWLGGVEILDSNLLGTFGLEPAISQIQDTGKKGYAGRLRYIHTDYFGPGNSQRNLSLGVEYRSQGFAQLDDLAPNVVAAYALTMGISQVIGFDIAARLSGNYDFNRATLPGVRNDFGAMLSFVKTWKLGMQTTLSFSRRSSQVGLREDDIFFLFSWVLPGTRQSITLSEDTAQESTRAEWRYNSPQQVGAYNTMVSYQKDPNSHKADASLDYYSNRGNISVAHDVTGTTGQSQYTSSTNGRIQQTTNLRAGASLAFVGGRFAIGRPITDSFAIVANNSALENQRVDINPNNSEYYDARTDLLGPGLVPNIVSYQFYHLYLDPSRLEPGFELGQENYALHPSYKSGTLIEAGNGATVMLDGVLTDTSDAPLSLASGEALLQDAPSAKPILFFTNRKGKFRAEGFKPGTYRLTFYSQGLAPLTFTIPEKARGIYKIGRLKTSKLK